MSGALKIIPALTPINQWPGRDGHRVRAVVLHITDGDTADGAIGWFRSPASQVSAHYVIDRAGTIYQTVREEDTAWANGRLRVPDLSNGLIRRWVERGINPNKETVSIEAVGRPAQGYTAAQLAAARYLVGQISQRWGFVPSAETVIGHHQLDSVTRSRCPSLTAEQWTRLRTPVAASDDDLLEAVYQRDPERWGERRWSGHLDRDWYRGKVLRTERALLTPDGRDLAATNIGNILDDWEQRGADIGLTRY